jgi:transcriptional regulator with XRE-family HTH domain
MDIQETGSVAAGTGTIDGRAEGGPAVLRQRLGSELRRLREARALRLEDVAGHLGIKPSTLSRIETGKAPARTSYVHLILDLYQVNDDGPRRELIDIAREGQRKSFWARNADVLPAGAIEYLGLEAAASEISMYCVQALPGLVQTEAYALAACRASFPGLNKDQAGRLAAVQMRRQELLLDSDHALRLVIDEPALRQVIGSADILAGQLEHLARLAASATVTVRVVPLDTTRNVLSPAFSVLRIGDSDDQAVAWVSGLGLQVTVSTRDKDLPRAVQNFDALNAASRSRRESASLIRQLAERARAALGSSR